jgi:UDP-glucose:(heptosyl)LPS alpha-1,3-glucosyltransferase
MRIGLVLDAYDPRRGGVEQWTHQFATQLLAAGHEVHAVARSFAPGAAPAGLQCHAIEAGSSRLQFAAATEAKLRTLALDIVHDTGCGTYADVFQPHGGSRVAAFEQNVALMPAWQRPWKRTFARWLPRYQEFAALCKRQYANDGRVILALSNMVAEDLRRFHGVPREHLRVIYNGVDTDRFSPAWRATYREEVRARLGVRDEVLLLIVAHNFRLKGVPTLLKATARLVRAGLTLRVAVAGGKHLSAARRSARRLGIEHCTTFLGSIDDVVPYYAAADVYVQPTFYDPCSLVVLEALASGLPVITTRHNGAGELITPGKEGEILANANDAEALATSLMPLVTSPELRDRMGLAARKLALEHTHEKNREAITKVYEQILATRQKATSRAA